MSAKTAVAAPPAGWRNRITGSGEEAPDQLLANPANWRIHPKAQQDALAGALDAVGWVQQVLVNRRTGFVVDGHARVALALSRGEPTVPVLYVDLEPAEEALVLATLDPIGAMAGRDDEKLKALLADVTVDDAGLLALARRPRRQRAEGRADRPRRGARAARGAVRQAGRALASGRPPDPVRRRDERPTTWRGCSTARRRRCSRPTRRTASSSTRPGATACTTGRASGSRAGASWPAPRSRT